MKKIYLVLLLCLLASCLFVSCLFAKPKKKSIAPGRIQIIDYQGAEFGINIPSWVQYSLAMDTTAVKEALNISENTEVYIFSEKFETEENLDKWLHDNEIKKVVKDTVSDILESDNVIVNEKKLEDIIAEYKVPGLTIHSTFWTYNRKAKENISNPKKDSDFYFFYNGFKIISMPQEKYDNFVNTILNEYKTR